MLTVTDTFLQAIRRPHTPEFFVDVFKVGVNVTPNPYKGLGLPVTGGSVTADRNSQTRRILSLSLAANELTPADAQSLLSPYGTELRVRRGIRFPNGSIEWVTLGWFRIETADLTQSGDSGTSELAITGIDRMGFVIDDRFQSVVASKNTTVVQEIQAHLFADAKPSWVPGMANLTVDNTACPTMTYDDKDRAGAIAKAADAISAEFFFSADGVPTLAPAAALDPSNPKWTIDVGTGGAMLTAQTTVSREKIYNIVVATGESTDAGGTSCIGVAQDTDPASQTRVGGPFGKKQAFITSPILKTNTQALHAAQSKLSAYTGAGWNIAVTSLVNPALDVGDTVLIVLPDGRRQFHIIDQLSIPLDTTTEMSIATRSNDPDGDVTEDAA